MRAVFRPILALFGPIVLSSACAPPQPAEQRSAIVGGTSDTADPGVVLLIGKKPSSTSIWMCTGEVISPHVVLTAAHCVDPAKVGTGVTFSIFLGDDYQDPSQYQVASNYIDVASTDFDAAFDLNTAGGGHDIAVAITSTALPAKPLAVNQDALGDGDLGSPLRLVGYGITSSTSTTTAGVKRQVSTTLAYYDDLFVSFGDATHNICEGDSGGPAFMTLGGKEVIVGVTSFGDTNCMQKGVDTRVDMYWDAFIAPHIQAAGDTVPAGPPSPDASTPPTGNGADLGSTSGSGKELGASCTDSNECASTICTLGSHQYCTAACDPASANACPSGMHCGSIQGTNYCLLSDSGCSAASGSLPGGGAPGGLALLFLAFIVARRRLSLGKAA